MLVGVFEANKQGAVANYADGVAPVDRQPGSLPLHGNEHDAGIVGIVEDVVLSVSGHFCTAHHISEEPVDFLWL